MVKVTKRNTNEKSGRETLRRVAGPTTSQLRESKLSIRTLSSSVALLQETRAMKEERELVQKMQALTVLDPKSTIDDGSKIASSGGNVNDQSSQLKENVISINQDEQTSINEDVYHRKYKTIPRSMLFKLFRLCYLDLTVDLIDLDQ
ncbi:predicted protein [Lichtheimia corymbifera JMRC:FSU:9682]|uniref:Uncharacterized protein n=1 Tax=Lichtheimia corymbifera JMRC:FSU:9682 TaxID=1263082 RepID=A0A068SGN3_9FUNG|nr:predicted protein [Lichtheimia corymbifera JMRC:FSU:9682]